MSTTPNTIQGLPAGAVVTPINSAAQSSAPDFSQVQGLPAGATVTPVSGTTTSTEQPGMLTRAANAVGEFGAGIVPGAVEEMGKTIQGIPYVGKKIISPEAMAAEQAYFAPRTGAEAAGQTAGKVAETGLEFAVGDEALSGLAKATRLAELADKIPMVNRVVNAAHEHPWIAKLITETTKGATVGGAQGALKNSDDRLAGAEGGAIGGGVGGAIGGGIEAMAGLPPNPFATLQRAIKPTGKLAENFAEKAELALPRIAKEAIDTKTSVTNLDELSDAAHNAAHKLWNNEVIPQIQRHANEIIPGTPVANAIRQGGLAGDKDLFPDAADAAEEFAKKFDSDMTLQQASDRMLSLNRKLSSLYKLDPASRYAATANNATLEAMEDAANELRQQISTKLESLGEPDPSGLRETYGALKTVERAAEKRAIVYNRLQPINLGQQFASAIGAAHTVGHLLAGDIPGAVAGAAPMVAAKVSKTLNSPEYLINQALNPEGGAIGALARKAAMPLANVGAQVGQEVTNPE